MTTAQKRQKKEIPLKFRDILVTNHLGFPDTFLVTKEHKDHKHNVSMPGQALSAINVGHYGHPDGRTSIIQFTVYVEEVWLNGCR